MARFGRLTLRLFIIYPLIGKQTSPRAHPIHSRAPQGHPELKTGCGICWPSPIPSVCVRILLGAERARARFFSSPPLATSLGLCPAHNRRPFFRAPGALARKKEIRSQPSETSSNERQVTFLVPDSGFLKIDLSVCGILRPSRRLSPPVLCEEVFGGYLRSFLLVSNGPYRPFFTRIAF